MIDRLRQLAIFAKTIDHGSFRGAAKELKVSPSVVSHHISRLEENLGVALLYRTTRKLSLTPDGERLLLAARNMLEAVETELSDISSNSPTPSGELRVTLPSVLSNSKLTDGLASFTVKYPKIRLNMHYTDERKELVGDGLDVAFRMSLRASNSQTSRILFSAERRILACNAYLKTRENAEVEHPKDLTDWDWLTLSPVHNRGVFFISPENRKVKVKPAVRITSNDAQSLYRMVRAGVGIAALPTFLATDDIANGLIETILPDWKLPLVHICAEWPTNAPKGGLVTLLVDHLAAEFDEL